MSTPSKQQVRDWQKQRVKEKSPPPTPEEVRRQLGWDLLKDSQKQDKVK